MNKCWYCNNELTSGDNPKHFGICNKCYDEMFKSGDTIIRSLTDKIAELQKQLEEKEKKIRQLDNEKGMLLNNSMKLLKEKDKKIEKLREWISQCEADKKSEQEKKNLAFNKWKESKEDALCLQQIYSHLGVEAYGEDIQEQAIKRIDAFKAINCPPELIGKDVYLIGADEFHEYILYKNALPVEVGEGKLLTKEQIAQLQARDDQLREVERKAYQEGLLQKQFDKDAKIMLLEQEIEDLKRRLMEKNS